MFNYLKTAETKRIEFLFNRYKNILNKGISDAEARMELIGELQMRCGLLKEQFEGQDNESKKKVIKNIFSPLEIIEYDVFRLIDFMVSWEFPRKYNYMPTIKQIRSGRHNRAYLEEKNK
jgi:hypothetical protein